MNPLGINGTKRLKAWMWSLAAGWTVVVTASLFLTFWQIDQKTLSLARAQARASFEKDVLYRRWAALQGGVYVPATVTAPNPYLKVPEREINTPTGRVLTLVNPAYMTRLVHELGRQTSGNIAHITSLDPIQPVNAPDRWETFALGQFELGAKEVWSAGTEEYPDHLRFMRPLITEKGCLKCHSEQGYKLGSIRGGISVTIPLAPLWKIARPHKNTMGLTYTLLWGLGLTGILWGGRQFALRSLELTHHTFHDHLTGLPNRMLLMDRLAHSIDVARRAERMVGVLLLDIDHFKHVNDSLGHDKGDKVLVMAAERLRCALRRKDTVARFGGDEFVILMDDAREAMGYIHVARNIIERFGEPFGVNGHEIHLGVSIGIAIYPEDGESPENLIKNADLAMYRSKARGKNTFSLFTRELNEKALLRITLESELRCALAAGEFELYYQPKIDLTTGTVYGAEALVRWPKPDGTLVSPGDFIPLAEETGLIIDLDRLVLERACVQIRKFREENLPPRKISVNLSALQFQREDLYRTIEETLETTGAEPGMLDIELTETALMSNIAVAREVLTKINRLGVTISLDDFGTGYSSLHYLQELPIQTLKIDKKFLDNMHSEKGAVFLRAIITMARNLGITVVAEGVEERSQLEFLRLNGCDEAQGFLFARPLPLEAFTAFVKERPRKMIELFPPLGREFRT